MKAKKKAGRSWRVYENTTPSQYVARKPRRTPPGKPAVRKASHAKEGSNG